MCCLRWTRSSRTPFQEDTAAGAPAPPVRDAIKPNCIEIEPPEGEQPLLRYVADETVGRNPAYGFLPIQERMKNNDEPNK